MLLPQSSKGVVIPSAIVLVRSKNSTSGWHSGLSFAFMQAMCLCLHIGAELPPLWIPFHCKSTFASGCLHHIDVPVHMLVKADRRQQSAPLQTMQSYQKYHVTSCGSVSIRVGIVQNLSSMFKHSSQGILLWSKGRCQSLLPLDKAQATRCPRQSCTCRRGFALVTCASWCPPMPASVRSSLLASRSLQSHLPVVKGS